MNNHSIIEIFVVGMAVWRLSKMITEEDGPFDLFERIRLLAGLKYSEYGVPIYPNWVTRGLVCLWCVSFWISALAWIAFASDIISYIVGFLAVSCFAILLDCVIESMRGRNGNN